MNTLVKPLILATATSLLLSGCQQDATASQSATAQDSSPRLDARAQRVEIANVKPAKQALTLTLPGEVEGSRCTPRLYWGLHRESAGQQR